AVPATWRSEFRHAVSESLRPRSDPRQVDLALDADSSPYLSFSVFAFRRAPWPARLVAVPLRRAGVEQMRSVPPLRALRGLARTVYRALSCGSD
ncbi:MAG TPA: hypothetical protein VKA53_04585, partial [Thermoanaerobaculia bacterium]|nr:hypothetical protein [Thermoanaerobaculia bacterium]